MADTEKRTLQQCEIVAVVSGKKTRADKIITECYHRLQHGAALKGFTRTFQPNVEGGETYPDEKMVLQVKAKDVVETAVAEWEDLINLIAAQDCGNTVAKANVIVNGTTLLENVPATHLLYLEKQLDHMRTFYTRLPILDPAEVWEYESGSEVHRSHPVVTSKTKKVQKPITLAHATKEHPAQTQLISEDVIIGEWTAIKVSGAVTEVERDKLVAKVIVLRDAVKQARERANSTQIETSDFGTKIANYLRSK
jgi:hypothetical protein